MKRFWAVLIVFALAGAIAVSTGCAKKDETAGTTTDSTLTDSALALGDLPNEDVPEATSPAPGENYSQAPPPAQSRPSTSRPRRQTPSQPAPSRDTDANAGTSSRSVTVPAGTSLTLSMNTEVNTKEVTAGDTFTATLVDDIIIDGRTAFPAGATVTGHVVESQRAGKASGRSRLVLAYDNISVGGKTYALDTVGAPIIGKSGTAKDAATIVGGAAAGAILGKVIGGSGSDAAKGAVVGGAAGTAATLMTRGPDVDLDPGEKVTVTLDRSVTVRTSTVRT